MKDINNNSILKVVRIGNFNRTVEFTPINREKLEEKLNLVVDSMEEFFKTVSEGKSINH
jgi:hypothetical protein